MKDSLDLDIKNILIEKKIIKNESFDCLKLTGGVSSDIWKISSLKNNYCIKKSKNKLSVKQDWYAPVIRNYYEHEWYNEVNNILPNLTPKVIYKNIDPYFFVMEHYDKNQYPLWKNELFNLKLDSIFTKNVAINLGKIHSKTYNKSDIAKKFDTIKLFEDLRIDPYIRSTALLHDDIKNQLFSIADNLHKSKIALVHGDISPKNILINNKNPIFLDAECAWFGDPVFDISFCLNHIILKSVVLEKINKELMKLFNTLTKNYLTNVLWEDPKKYEKRIIIVLSSLMLSRIDGKSPVEYINSELQKNKVRNFAKSVLKQPLNSLLEFSEKWLIN
tara:strand:+ start:1160 stop:2155 length:996 start_codon:yes stop_codon:yes gene_type:complete